MTKGEKTKKSILDASCKLFAKKGFKDVTMKDICDVTGLSRGGLYRYFGSTEDIFEELIAGFATGLDMDFSKAMDVGISAVTLLDRVLARLAAEMTDSENSLSAAMYEYGLGHSGYLFADTYASVKKLWQQLIEYGRKTGEFSYKLDSQDVADTLIFAYEGVRMASHIISITPETSAGIIAVIRKSVVKE